GFAVRAEALEPVDWTLLCALAAGATLGQAADALGRHAARRLGPALERLAAAGVIVGFDAAGGG
ncbi:MAG TPA: hypothetical protein VLC53_15330, partial [Myxococcota bacterium]|nr:hypothetical protein [Myxococcota bacterium]